MLLACRPASGGDLAATLTFSPDARDKLACRLVELIWPTLCPDARDKRSPETFLLPTGPRVSRKPFASIAPIPVQIRT